MNIARQMNRALAMTVCAAVHPAIFTASLNSSDLHVALILKETQRKGVLIALAV